jgi:hypothetical protein
MNDWADEKARSILGLGAYQTDLDCIAAALRAAVEEERMACEQIARGWVSADRKPSTDTIRREVADAIAARKAQP